MNNGKIKIIVNVSAKVRKAKNHIKEVPLPQRHVSHDKNHMMPRAIKLRVQLRTNDKNDDNCGRIKPRYK